MGKGNAEGLRGLLFRIEFAKWLIRIFHNCRSARLPYKILHVESRFYLFQALMRYRVNCPYNLSMTPYMLTGWLRGSYSVFLLLFIFAALFTALSGQIVEATPIPFHVKSLDNALTWAGFLHHSQLDYAN